VGRHVFRFFATGEHEPGETVRLAADDRRHALRVLRLRPGDAVELVDARGVAFDARLAADGAVELVAALPAVLAPEGPLVWLALAGGRADLAVEKLTELGARGIGALRAERGRGEPRLERWRRLVEAAAKQARRERLPELLGPAPLADVLAPGAILLDHEAPDAEPFGAAPSAVLLVGPEAGWSDAERAAARAAGVPLMRLGGGLVLRSETAAIAACALAALAPATA
jgi:16S rRNA (uracil1498-N3)-methyltransferase